MFICHGFEDDSLLFIFSLKTIFLVSKIQNSGRNKRQLDVVNKEKTRVTQRLQRRSKKTRILVLKKKKLQQILLKSHLPPRPGRKS